MSKRLQEMIIVAIVNVPVQNVERAIGSGAPFRRVSIEVSRESLTDDCFAGICAASEDVDRAEMVLLGKKDTLKKTLKKAVDEAIGR